MAGYATYGKLSIWYDTILDNMQQYDMMLSCEIFYLLIKHKQSMSTAIIVEGI